MRTSHLPYSVFTYKGSELDLSYLQCASVTHLFRALLQPCVKTTARQSNIVLYAAGCDGTTEVQNYALNNVSPIDTTYLQGSVHLWGYMVYQYNRAKESIVD